VFVGNVSGLVRAILGVTQLFHLPDLLTTDISAHLQVGLLARRHESVAPANGHDAAVARR